MHFSSIYDIILFVRVSGEKQSHGDFTMKAVITVVGRDSIGIIAGVSAECAKYGVNISEITQSVLSDYFVMIMIVDIDGLVGDFSAFVDAMEAHGKSRSLEIHVMHENIFDVMHEI